MHAFDRQTDGRTERPWKYRALHYYMQSHGNKPVHFCPTQFVSLSAWVDMCMKYERNQRVRAVSAGQELNTAVTSAMT